MNRSKLLVAVLCILSYHHASAQVDEAVKDKVVLVDFAQPVVGQVQAGILLPTNTNVDFFVYGKYNYNFVPDRVGYVRYRYSFGYGYGYRVSEYSEWEATESGFTIGAQIRRNIVSSNPEYNKYLKQKETKTTVYYGAWLDYGNTLSRATEHPYAGYEIEGYVPEATANFITVSGGLLFGLKLNLSKKMLLDMYTGLGLRSISAMYKQPGLDYEEDTQRYTYNGIMHQDEISFVSATARLGIQLGYKF